MLSIYLIRRRVWTKGYKCHEDDGDFLCLANCLNIRFKWKLRLHSVIPSLKVHNNTKCPFTVYSIPRLLSAHYTVHTTLYFPGASSGQLARTAHPFLLIPSKQRVMPYWGEVSSACIKFTEVYCSHSTVYTKLFTFYSSLNALCFPSSGEANCSNTRFFRFSPIELVTPSIIIIIIIIVKWKYGILEVYGPYGPDF